MNLREARRKKGLDQFMRERDEAATRGRRLLKFEAILKLIDEAFVDPRPNVPASEVFKRLKAHHARRVKGRRREKI